MKNNDQNIIERIRSDSRSIKNRALEELYISYYPIIKNYINKNSGNDIEAEDIFQDAVIVLYTKVRQEDFELSCALKTFIYSICRNLWLNRLKTKGKILSLSEDFKETEIQAEDLEILDPNTKHKKIRALFDHIDEKCKNVLYNFYFHRMSMQAIANDMGFANAQVAKNKKSRCLKKLKNLVFNKTKLS